MVTYKECYNFYKCNTCLKLQCNNETDFIHLIFLKMFIVFQSKHIEVILTCG